MSDLLQSSTFVTWSKGPAALETVKKSLCDLIRSVWNDFLNTLSVEEIEHLQEFIEDVGDVKADQKKKKWVFKCDHKLCPVLLGKLNEIRHNKKSMKSVWKTGCVRECPEDLIGLAVIFYFNYWHIANMFMLYGNERNEIPNTCPEDTDVAMVLKMMQNCTLFEIDDYKLYDEVINIRNRIFHTGSYNLSEEDIKLFIDTMIELLKGVSEMANCNAKHRHSIESGINELHELAERNVVTISAQKDWKAIALKALEVQKQAIQLDINVHCTASLDTTSLRSILKTTDERIQEFTNSIEWRQIQTNNRWYSAMRIGEDARSKAQLLRRISELEGQLLNRNMNQAGELAEAGAQVLNDFGPVGRAVGSIGGGAVGTVAEGFRRLFSWD